MPDIIPLALCGDGYHVPMVGVRGDRFCQASLGKECAMPPDPARSKNQSCCPRLGRFGVGLFLCHVVYCAVTEHVAEAFWVCHVAFLVLSLGMWFGWALGGRRRVVSARGHACLAGECRCGAADRHHVGGNALGRFRPRA